VDDLAKELKKKSNYTKIVFELDILCNGIKMQNKKKYKIPGRGKEEV
jgi:hypothetical protein